VHIALVLISSFFAALFFVLSSKLMKSKINKPSSNLTLALTHLSASAFLSIPWLYKLINKEIQVPNKEFFFTHLYQ
jgi:ascorbate-specific PTS system EIIC-type component UlaA